MSHEEHFIFGFVFDFIACKYMDKGDRYELFLYESSVHTESIAFACIKFDSTIIKMDHVSFGVTLV